MVRHSREWLSCTGCGDEFVFSDAGVFQYTDLEQIADFREADGHCWSVLAVPCWCLECNRPTFAERIPTLKEFLNAAAIRRIPDGPRKHGIDDVLLYIDPWDFDQLAATLPSRTSKPTCLLCGSTSFIVIDGWQSKTTLRHESCGSEMTFHRVIQGVIGRRDFRYYSATGKLIGSLSGVA